MCILIIDDDVGVVDCLTQVLRSAGYSVFAGNNASQGFKLFETLHPDLVILDVLLPDGDGWEICRQIRRISDVPITMLSGYAVDIEDHVRGLHVGADDYLTKPIDIELLKARVFALLRRSRKTSWAECHPGYADAYLVIDLSHRRVSVGGCPIVLSRLEFELLQLLVCNAGQIIPLPEIIEELWPAEASDRRAYTVRTYIQRLRRKIEADPATPRYLINESGFGYKFDPHYQI